MSQNKVKYGLRNVHYAKATVDENGVPTYATPKPWPGAVNLSLDQEGGVTKFRADNRDYWMGQSNNGYSGDFESAIIPDSFREDILGEVKGADGTYTEYADAKTIPFALLFQFEGDVKNVRHVLYYCTATRPEVNGETTDEEIEPRTETLEITAGSCIHPTNGRPVVKRRCEEGSEAYDAWFNEVKFVDAADEYVYTAITPEGTENPSSEGWYEKDGTSYKLSADTTVDNDKTYYTRSKA